MSQTCDASGHIVVWSHFVLPTSILLKCVCIRQFEILLHTLDFQALLNFESLYNTGNNKHVEIKSNTDQLSCLLDGSTNRPLPFLPMYSFHDCSSIDQ